MQVSATRGLRDDLTLQLERVREEQVKSDSSVHDLYMYCREVLFLGAAQSCASTLALPSAASPPVHAPSRGWPERSCCR